MSLKKSPKKLKNQKNKSMTVKQLKAECKRKGIKGYSKLKKVELEKKCLNQVGSGKMTTAEIYNRINNKRTKRKYLIQIADNLNISLFNSRDLTKKDLIGSIIKKLPSCHLYDNEKKLCNKSRVRKGLLKYDCQFIVDNKKPSKCIKKGNLSKYKGYKVSN